MPQIGWFELLIVVLVAILVIGPKDFPIVLKKVGSWIGTTKRYFSDIQNKVNQSIDEEETVEKIRSEKQKSSKLEVDDDLTESDLKDYLFDDKKTIH